VRFLHHIIAGCLLLAVASCTPGSQDPDVSDSFACADKQCPIGEECEGGGCVSVRPTLYSHIQLGTSLLRSYNDATEITWRANHSDMVIGLASGFADELRAENPNIRITGYFTNTYHRYVSEAEEWAAARGEDPEDYYLHYKEDVYRTDYAHVVLVPGFSAGVIPGWNPNWQTGDPPASATNRSQSRAPAFYSSGRSTTWYLANLANAGYRSFLADYVRSLLDGTLYNTTMSTGPADGAMVDNAIYYPEFNEGNIDKTTEFYGVSLDENHPYPIGFEYFYPELRAYLSLHIDDGTDVMANYSASYFLSRKDRFSQNIQQLVDWAWAEVWIIYRGGYMPTTGARVTQYDKDYTTSIANIVRQTRAGGRRILGARDWAQGVGGSDRGRLFTLGLYYLVHNANTFYVYESSRDHRERSHVSQWMWNPAVTYDIGQPAPVPAGFDDFEGVAGSTEHFVMESGPDPFDPSLTYHLLARQFTKGLVLVKMLPTGSVDDPSSATIHTLPGSYALLLHDGTKGAVVTQVAIRNNEAIILVDP